jgi:hypothetical protein
VVAGDWVINKAWDNRTLHNSWAAGSWTRIDRTPCPSVQLGCERAKQYAKNAVEGHSMTGGEGAVQFNLYADDWDRLGINFGVSMPARGNHHRLQNNLGAYGVFDGVGTIRFELNPKINLSPNSGGNAGVDRRPGRRSPGLAC